MDYPGKVITKTQVTPTQTSASGNWTLDDQAAAIKNNNWPVALVPNPISKSLRFNSADSAYLNRTPASAGNRRTWTWSGWVKRSALSSTNWLMTQAAGSGLVNDGFFLSSGLSFYWNFQGAGGSVDTSAVFRDASAWYHIVVKFDTTQATSTNRIIFYVNGVQQTQTGSYPAQNYDGYINSAAATDIGRLTGDTYFSGYMTEINFIDGQALTPSSFGMTNPQTGQWIPLKYSGTYGTNGFYLNFKDATSTTTLGLDYSGNANNWTTNNFSVTAGAGNDSLTDVPTPWFAYNTTGDVGGVIRGNYATLNPVWKNLYPGVYANGNLDFSTSTAKYGNAFSTIGLTSGKWYVEVLVSGTIGSALKLGVSNQTTLNYLVGTEDDITPTTGVGYGYYLTNGNKATNGTTSAYGTSVASGDIVGIILDLDNGKIWFSKNGTVQASGDPVAGTNAAFTGITASSVWFFGGTTYTTQASFVFNFGQRPFAYTPPTGFRSLCTTNLPATAIGFGLTNQAGNYFNIGLWTSNNSASNIAVTGIGFQPDFFWGKLRTAATGNRLIDSMRGVTKILVSNSTTAELTESDAFASFNSDGFTIGQDTTGGGLNYLTNTGVGWVWKGNGTGVSNTAGTITSTVSANTTAGFSIVTYTGNNTTGATIGHGLGVAPSMIIIKDRLQGTGYNWNVYHASIGNTQRLFLDATSAAAAGVWNNTSPTSTVFTLTNNVAVNGTDNYVAYCFAPVPGYSAFGSYTGNASTDGPFVYLGFRPRFIFGKDSGGTNNWWIFDSARDTYNVAGKILRPNLSDAELDSPPRVDLLSNGFKIRNVNLPNDATTYIYAAFAESPFQFSNAR